MAPPAANEIVPGIWRWEKVASSGWCWNMLALRLRSGGLLVHSPTWLGEGTFEALERLGTPELLLAPNHFHHLDLERFRARWPGAIAIASRQALQRLARQGHAGMIEAGEAGERLAEGARFLPNEGARSGEVWLLVPPGPTLIVCDAFFDIERPVSGVIGFALRSLRVVPGLQVSRTFRWLALSDPARYLAWATETLERERPTRMVPSHGEPIEAPDLASRLVASLRAAL
jgi:hypothetical protein